MANQAVFLVMGVSGCGKSTVAKLLAEKLGPPSGRFASVTFLEGDDFHPHANRDKMASGQPLTDEDRAGWLATIRAEIDQQLLSHQRAGSFACVLSCSALKGRYRSVLLRELSAQVHLAFLNGSYEVIAERMQARSHFMPVSLLRSQFAILEAPQQSEFPIARLIVVDIDKVTPISAVEQVIAEIVE